MATVQEHYDSHLAPLYTWMSGGEAAPRARFAHLLRDLKLAPTSSHATAMDLGAGSGFQSIPLAEAGYAVTAIDVSERLLAELRHAVGALPIRTVHADLRSLSLYLPQPAPELIVCLGDTLTHLATLHDVTSVIQDTAHALAPGGHLLLGFRDYTHARVGADRFIPVRSEIDRIFTCFLDFHSPSHLSVHDIVQLREPAGWRMAVSAYEKIRLDPAWVATQLTTAGLAITWNHFQHGVVTLAARRPVLS